MTRRAQVWWGVGVLALIGVVVAWFLSELTQVPTTRWERQGAEARRNPYLALERFLDRIEKEVVKVNERKGFDAVPADAVVILDRGRRRSVSPERAEALLRWVEAGGYLIVAAENRQIQDPLLKSLDVSWRDGRHRQEEEDDGERPGRTRPRATGADATVVKVPIPGGSAPVMNRSWGGGLATGKVTPSWAAQTADGETEVVHFAWGKGQITVFTEFRVWTNERIGQRGHADVLWRLLEAYRPESPVWLAVHFTVPSLWEWLLEAAWMPLVSAALLIAFWLWRIVPRFGGLRGLPPESRRGLGDHLLAMGRGVWREGGLHYWLELVREGLRARLAQRHPHLLALPFEECARALAELSGLSVARVKQALEGRGAESPRTFIDTLRTIQQLLHKL